jgi:RNA polymerase sigma-70 factor (ECF subfamily)
VLRAWRRRATLRSADRRAGWLAAIARNEAFRHLARAHAEPTVAAERGSYEDERVLALVEGADVRAALRRLDSSDRRLLHLRYERDLTQAAIAKILRMPEGTVKVRLHRARGKLRRALEG